MKTLSRRDLLKSSLLAPAAVAAQGMGPMGAAIEAIAQEAHPQPANAAPNPSASGAGRERLLLDFGWRFHLGNCQRCRQGFRLRQRPRGQLPEDRQLSARRQPSALTTATGSQSICPTTGPSSCRFKNDPALASKGFYPLGRNYPEHQRRLVPARLRAARGGRRQAHHARI